MDTSPEGGAVRYNQVYALINEQATKENIKAKLTALQQRVREDDLFYFYFSGHGRDGAFLPYDYNGNYPESSLLHHREIVEAINQINARQKVIIADACHAGSLTGFRDNDKSVERYYDELNRSAGGIAVITSCQQDEVSVERYGLQQGVFSYYFHEGLRGAADTNADNIITIQEAYDYAEPLILKYTDNQQRPNLWGQYDPKMVIGVVRE